MSPKSPPRGHTPNFTLIITPQNPNSGPMLIFLTQHFHCLTHLLHTLHGWIHSFLIKPCNTVLPASHFTDDETEASRRMATTRPEVSYKTKHTITMQPNNGIQRNENMCSQKNQYTTVYSRLIIVKNWEQSRYPLVCEAQLSGSPQFKKTKQKRMVKLVTCPPWNATQQLKNALWIQYT